jgi:Cell division septal protein
MEPQQEKRRVFSKQIATMLIGLVVFVVLAVTLVYSPFFIVKSIIIKGNQYVSEQEIREAAGIKGQENMFLLTTSVMQQRLNKDLRIEQATVRRVFPSTIEITVAERMPVATIACSYGFLDLGQTGLVLNAYRKFKTMQVPAITGLALNDLYVGDQVENITVQKALEFLSYLDEASRRQLSEVNVAEPEHITAYTASGVQIRLGSTERMAEKAKSTQNFLVDLKSAKYPIEYIDFNYSAPFIKFKK